MAKTTVYTIYTIGFTKKSAEKFFNFLQSHHITCLVDIRLHPGGQLAGFTKQDDLAFFLSRLLSCAYKHLPELAPTDEILTGYRTDKNWQHYVQRFEALMDERHIPDALDRQLFETQACCLLCSEATPEQCHRRLVAERMAQRWGNVAIIHII